MQIIETFKTHMKSVEKLMNFDRDVLDHAIISIEDLQKRLTQHHEISNAALTAERTLTMLRGYRKNDSLRSRYETIFNQALVLLTSYFTSSISDLFKIGVSKVLDKNSESPLHKEQIKISFRDLRENDFNLKEIAPELLILAKDISFQDMQSISRAFKDHLGISIEKDKTVNEIILGVQCRHIIVHTAGLADDRLIRQLANAYPRDLKNTLKAGEKIQFTVEEVNSVGAAMLEYLEAVSAKIELL